jgi:hypothetical protein
MSRAHCQTGKKLFRSEEQAKRALTLIRQHENDGKGIPSRYYECPFGPGRHYHLTSQTLRDYGGILRYPREPEPPAELTPLEKAERDRDTLERIVRKCIAEGCGTCMHSSDWGRFLIEHMTTTTEGTEQ